MSFFTRLLLVAALALPLQSALAAPAGRPAVEYAARGVFGQGTLSLTVYPNPGHGVVAIQLTAPVGADYKFRLHNVLGRELRTLTLRPDLMAGTVALDVSSLPAGLYFYSLVVNDKVVSTNRLTLQ